MGVLSELVIADPTEVEEVRESEQPTQHWDGFSFQGLDRVKLVTLWSLIETGVADNELESRLAAVQPNTGDDHGPWVDTIPAKMLSALASVAALEEDAFAGLSGKWAATEEFEGWSQSDVEELLRGVGDAADSAQLAGKTLLLWTSL